MKKSVLIIIVAIILIVPAVIIIGLKCCSPDSQATAGRDNPAADGNDTEEGEDKLLNIVVSSDLMRELVYRFARTRVKEAPYLIIKPGVNPLTYKPTREDEQKMLAADLVLYDGLGLAPGLEKMIKKIKKKVRCEAVTDILKKEDLLRSRDYPGGYDPHYWWDPGLWEKILYRVLRIFEEIDVYGAANYGYIYVRYGEATNLLNLRSMQIQSNQIPEQNRVLVTLHPAFTYFGRAFGYNTLSLYKPGQENYERKRMDELVNYIVDHQVPAIFPEYGYSDNDLKTLQAEVKKRGYDVALADPLYSYFLAPMGEKDYTYLSAGETQMEHIYQALKPAHVAVPAGETNRE